MADHRNPLKTKNEMKALFVFIILLSLSVISNAQQKPVDEKSEVSFTIKNFGLNTSGTLKGLKGTIKFDASNPSASAFDVLVDVNTINTGIDNRDNHLKKEEYFDVEKYPAIKFVSGSIKKDNENYSVTGNLTIKGITKNISFPFKAENKDGGVLLTGEFTINRKDFNVGGSSAVLGNSVNVNLKVFAN